MVDPLTLRLKLKIDIAEALEALAKFKAEAEAATKPEPDRCGSCKRRPIRWADGSVGCGCGSPLPTPEPEPLKVGDKVVMAGVGGGPDRVGTIIAQGEVSSDPGLCKYLVYHDWKSDLFPAHRLARYQF